MTKLSRLSNILLQMRQLSNRKANSFKPEKRFFAVLGLLFLIAAASFDTQAQTVVVNQTSIQGWIFYNDENDKIDPTLGKFVSGPATPPSGTGSAQISVTGMQRRNLATYQFSGTPLADITTMAYSTYNPSAGNGGSPNRSAYLNFNVDFNGSDTWQRRLIFLPSDNGTVVQNSWQEWNTINGGAALWRYSGPTWPAGIGEPGTTLGTTPKTWSQILGHYPGVRMRVTDSFLGLRVGEPYADGYTENIDAFKFGTASGTTTFDFDPATALAVSPAGAPTALDNDYTRINNAVQAIANGGTITLNGTFNWTEPNAAASWALGSNGQTGTGFSGDDYAILAPANLNGVTFTAASLGAATIQGPGDLPNENLEGVLQFYAGGTNQNWTISNIRFLDFDNAIGFYYVSGPSSIYNGTQIINNYILVARDLNATVAPTDVSQNIGIHFSFGDNQLISGNTIDIHGDGVSDGTNFSTEVAMQSNTSGGAYEGLQITNNTIRVLNAQSANPQVVIGIWENGHGHTKNITVSGNQFLNMAAGNNPSANLQRGFRVTSHSSASSTVLYLNNRVEGANIGFQWLAGGNFSAHQPVRLTSNVIRNNATGVLVDSSGSANISFNRIVGNTVAGVNNLTAGTVTAENNWWGCNYGPGAGGTGCVGTANGVLGTVDANPWLTLRTSASPTTILTNGNSSITSNLHFNSDNVNTSGSGSVPNGTPAGFSATLGTVSPTSSTTTAGVTGTTYTAGPVAGSGSVTTVVDGQSVATSITINSNVSCNNVSISTGMTVGTDSQFVVPINVNDTTGRGIFAYDFTLTYNPAVVALIGVETAGTLSSGWTITTNSSSGTLVVSGYGVSPLTGMGALLNVRFTSVGAIGTSSNLNLTSFTFNEGVPCVNVSNGNVTIVSGAISGRVTYGNAASPPVPVPNVLLNAAGSIPQSDTTDANGDYSMTGFGTGAYTVTPSKTGQVNGITNFDATAVAQHVVGFITLNPTQQLAADVTGNGSITSLDASYIAQYVASIPNPGQTGTWKFIPASRNYPNVQTSFANEDYSAILMGEVTGNWNPATPRPAGLELDGDGFAKRSERGTGKNQSEPTIKLYAPEAQAVSPGTDFLIELKASDTTGRGIFGYEFDFLYNPEVITPQANPCDSAGTLSDTAIGRTVICNPVSPGFLRVVMFSSTGVPVSGEGVSLKLRFTAVGDGGASSGLKFENFMFNEGIPGEAAIDGAVRIVQKRQRQ